VSTGIPRPAGARAGTLDAEAGDRAEAESSACTWEGDGDATLGRPDGAPVSPASVEDRDWQRIDKWLWCARFMRHRADCARLVAEGRLRINRQPTDKPHARLRVGDVITLPLRGEVRVIEVLALGARRGPAEAARALYREIPQAASAAEQRGPCGEAEEASYPAP
jgi:ribosome-associated heat shock protein Hsp15